MKTTINTTTKQASAKNLAPITINTNALDHDMWPILNTLSAKALIELLRERGINIPKRKGDMAERLVSWMDANNSSVTVTIG